MATSGSLTRESELPGLIGVRYITDIAPWGFLLQLRPVTHYFGRSYLKRIITLNPNPEKGRLKAVSEHIIRERRASAVVLFVMSNPRNLFRIHFRVAESNTDRNLLFEVNIRRLVENYRE